MFRSSHSTFLLLPVLHSASIKLVLLIVLTFKVLRMPCVRQFPHITFGNPSAFQTIYHGSVQLPKEIRSAVPKTRETIGALRILFGNFEGLLKVKVDKKRDGSFALSMLTIDTN